VVSEQVDYIARIVNKHGKNLEESQTPKTQGDKSTDSTRKSRVEKIGTNPRGRQGKVVNNGVIN
jgi:hypothetical protein